jgi:hypothetical protein
MTETTARFALPLIQVGQAQKEVTHNAALRRLDTVLNLAVASRSVAAPPPAPAAGAVWIVPSGASGAWSGQAGKLAEWDGAAWTFTAAPAGTVAWVADEGVLGVHDGAGWAIDFLPVGGLRIGGADLFGAARSDIAAPSGGGVVDVEARAALTNLLAYLRTQGLLGA